MDYLYAYIDVIETDFDDDTFKVVFEEDEDGRYLVVEGELETYTDSTWQYAGGRDYEVEFGVARIIACEAKYVDCNEKVLEDGVILSDLQEEEINEYLQKEYDEYLEAENDPY